MNLRVVPPIPTTGSCSLCRGPYAEEVAGLIAAGERPSAIERIFRASGRSLKAETVSRHVARHIEHKAPVVAKPRAGPATVRQKLVRGSADFAALVQAAAVDALQDGDLRVTTKDGLAAAAILDRRAEKSEDRKFMLNLAQLLSGGGIRPPEQLAEGAIEGDFVEIDNKLLAPASLRGDLPPS